MRLSSKTIVMLLIAVPLFSGCSVLAVADAAITVGAVAVKTTFKAAEAVVDVTSSVVKSATSSSDDQKAEEKKAAEEKAKADEVAH